LPAEENDGGRLTLKYDNPDVGLRVKLKGSFTHDTLNVWEGEFNQGGCALTGTTVPIQTTYDNCKPDRYNGGFAAGLPYNPNANFAFGSPDYQSYTMGQSFRNGQSYAFTNTSLGILNIDYDLAPGLTFSSVTGLDYVKAIDAGPNPSAAPINNIPLDGESKTQEFSQEIRLASNWKDRWYNFMIGGLYNTATRRDRLVIDYTGVTLFADDSTKYKTKTEGVFGQVMLTPIEHWELSAGVRYTHVYKHFVSIIGSGNAQSGASFLSAFGFGPPSLLTYLPPTEYAPTLSCAVTCISENATTPEVTLKYTPTDDFMAFASFKKGYKGPAINTGISFATFDPAGFSKVKGEKVTGGEGGIKAQFLDRQLSLTATGYLYQYNNLQVAFTDVAHSLVTVGNGANARIQGVELGADYAPLSVPGLTLNAFVNYNDSHYTSFPGAPCWGDEPASYGCVTTGSVSVQNLAGRTLSTAAKWVGSFGGTYKWDVNDGYTVSFNLGGRFSSSYYSSPELNPQGIQPAYVLLDVGMRFGPSDGRWEMSLQCKDCTNYFYLVNGTNPGPGTGDAIYGAPAQVTVARPRQILLQLTVHPWQG
jgi:outer membrane receptor protein involved in Fe transport